MWAIPLGSLMFLHLLPEPCRFVQDISPLHYVIFLLIRHSYCGWDVRGEFSLVERLKSIVTVRLQL